MRRLRCRGTQPQKRRSLENAWRTRVALSDKHCPVQIGGASVAASLVRRCIEFAYAPLRMSAPKRASRALECRQLAERRLAGALGSVIVLGPSRQAALAQP